MQRMGVNPANVLEVAPGARERIACEGKFEIGLQLLAAKFIFHGI